ncbi:hypothetical protein KP509_32G068900 [Ceratopteris richardii]|uniref:Uncharacterized protein n=1 Tax=Ceratopteris richardii TaxID=49495 RepID=A0A8T2QW61_CERRI|nr:hypothetical protein KP509_32G068900 [Ceratopteris richardii]
MQGASRCHLAMTIPIPPCFHSRSLPPLSPCSHKAFASLQCASSMPKVVIHKIFWLRSSLVLSLCGDQSYIPCYVPLRHLYNQDGKTGDVTPSILCLAESHSF